MILSCCKTGRWWPVRSEAHARRLVRLHGLTDYEIEGPAA